MRKFILTISISLLFIAASTAQEAKSLSAGIGLGLEYGKVGGQLIYQFDKLGIFAAGGFTSGGLAYNAGFKYFMPGGASKEIYYIAVMYGTNGFLLGEKPHVRDDEFENIYFGPTFGGGIDLESKSGNLYYNFSVLFPIKSGEFKRDREQIELDPASSNNFAHPISINLGVNFKILRKK